MKVKNIMFSGAMASILMIGGAYAAVTPSATTALLDPVAVPGEGEGTDLTTVRFVKGGVLAAENYAAAYTDHSIQMLDSEATGTSGGLTVTVTQTDGKLTGVTASIDANTYDSYGAADTAEANAVDAAKAIIGGDYSSTSTVASAIASNASAISALQSAVGTGETALGTRVTNLESAVNSETSGLATKASQSDLNALKGLVGTTAVATQISNAVAVEEARAKGVEGDKADLTTDAKGTLVAAINEVDAHADAAQLAANAAQSTADTAVANAATAQAAAEAAQNGVDALEELVGDTSVASQINAAIVGNLANGLLGGDHISITKDTDTGKTKISVTGIAEAW